MRYQKIAELYDSLSKTTKRLEKTQILSNFFQEMDDSESEILFLLMGEIYPTYRAEKIGISSQLVIKAISKAVGVDKERVVKEWKEVGDLGKVAEKLIKKKSQSTLQSYVLTTEKVLQNLRKLPELEGDGTVDKKMGLITELLTSASSLEALYIVRTLMNDLRVGIQESTIRDAMASAFFNGDKESSEIIQDALNKSNDVCVVFNISKTKKIEAFKKIKLEAGKPVRAMLAQKAKNVSEGFAAVGKPCALEYKYDGFRLMIHKQKDIITLFTRSLENVTKQFPEVVEYIKEYVKGDNFILDSEAVGFDKKTHEYKPFQEISQRIKRKYDIEKVRNELPVEVNVFDVLFYEGKSMLEEPFSKRTEFIKKIISNHPFKIIYSKQIITSDEEKAQEFYEEALKNNQEGVMMKNLDAVYNPGSRVGHMLKVKPNEKDFDLVITGGEFGTGKRSGWISSFILSCSNGEEFLEVGKVGTGFKEKKEEGVSFEELTEKIKPLIISENGKEVKIKPEIVIAITYQEIQQSPTYSSGFALRFPRFTALRVDKPLSEITSLEEIKSEFEKQKRI